MTVLETVKPRDPHKGLLTIVCLDRKSLCAIFLIDILERRKLREFILNFPNAMIQHKVYTNLNCEDMNTLYGAHKNYLMTCTELPADQISTSRDMCVCVREGVCDSAGPRKNCDSRR